MSISPGILTWNRLEPRPRSKNFDRTLRAEVRDALWMMTRQWQFGEYQAEDTGSAIYSRLQIKKNRLNTLQLGDVDNTPISVESNLPLEVYVEKEQIEFDFLMRLEMSRYWEKLISKRIKKEIVLDVDVEIDINQKKILIDLVISEFRKPIGPGGVELNFTMPDNVAANAAFYSNPDLWHATAAHTNGRAFDGYEFYKWLNVGSNDPASFVTASLGLDAPTTTTVLSIITTSKLLFLNWFDKNYSQPTTEDTAWNSSQLEYKFSMGAPNRTVTTPELVDVLTASEYYQGSLDWFAFDHLKVPLEYHPDLKDFDSALIEEENYTLIPSSVKFAGMPNPRWWEMEDRKVDLGDVNPSTTDTAKIIYSEFGLIYSNDWMIFPHTVEAGSLCEISDIVVTDCFGQQTKVVSASGTGELDDDWDRWAFFGLNVKGDETDLADVRLFIPPVAGQILESDPIETINFIRDEMANMVWGIEKIIPNGLGGGIDGYESALKHVDFLKTIGDEEIAILIDNDAVIKYKLTNSIPENWIPFVPKKLSDLPDSRQIQLQRAALPRYIDGVPIERIRPKTTLLQTNFNGITWEAYFIHEDEVPRAGAIVKRTWQRTRTEKGKVVTWTGRRKTTGRGEGSSNLSFDNIMDK